MEGIVVVGFDLAKNVFQNHGVAADGGVVVRRQVRRGQVLAFCASLAPCLVGMEPVSWLLIGLANLSRSAIRSG